MEASSPEATEQTRGVPNTGSSMKGSISTADGISCMPAELFLSIAIEIDDAKTCRTCRLVSRSWDCLFLPHAFKNLVIMLDPSGGKSIQAFHTFLAERGDIGCCIQHLYINHSWKGNTGIFDGGDLADLLASILRRLPHLARLRLPSQLCPQRAPSKSTAAASQLLRLHFLHIEMKRSTQGSQDSEIAVSLALARLLNLFESVDTLRLSTWWVRDTSSIDAPGQRLTANDGSDNEPSPILAVNHLAVVGDAVMMPDPRVHHTWFGQLRSLKIDGSKWNTHTENSLLEALLYMHDLEVFDASSEFSALSVEDPYTEPLTERYIPALAACQKLQTISVGVCVGFWKHNKREWSNLTRVLFQPLMQRASMLESVEVAIKQIFVPCGVGIGDTSDDEISDDEVMENLTAGADVMWKAAAQAVEAGKTRIVKFSMSAHNCWPDYIKNFAARMQEVVPGSVADGRLAVL